MFSYIGPGIFDLTTIVVHIEFLKVLYFGYCLLDSGHYLVVGAVQILIGEGAKIARWGTLFKEGHHNINHFVKCNLYAKLQT